MLRKHREKHGFTIVELLIVIVVIAILAALTVVAFNGIQQRASNTRRVAVAKEWQKIIRLYTTQNNSYPASTINNHTCLGTGNPTDLDINPDEDCNGTGNVKHPNTAINNAYATIAPLPSFPGDKLATSLAIGTTAGLGLRAIDTLDPATTPKTMYPMLHYWLNGNNQDCVLRPVGIAVSGGYAQTTAINSGNDSGLTHCVILLPDPANL